MPSFDIVSEVNQVEVQQRRRPDQQGSLHALRLQGVGLRASSTRTRCSRSSPTTSSSSRRSPTSSPASSTKRGVDIRSLKYGDVEKVSGNKVKQRSPCAPASNRSCSKKIVRILKDSKLKVQAFDPGRRRARVRRQARRAAERHRADQEVDHRLPAAVRQLPRLGLPPGAERRSLAGIPGPAPGGSRASGGAAAGTAMTERRRASVVSRWS